MIALTWWLLLRPTEDDNLRTYKGYTFDFEAIAAQLYRVTKPGGVVVWVVADETKNGSESGTSFRQALFFMGLGFGVETMIYEVNGTGAKGSRNLYWQSFEYMFVLSKGKMKTHNLIKDRPNKKPGKNQSTSSKYNGKTRDKGNGYVSKSVGIRTNIWKFHAGKNGDDDTEHEAPFPEALARDHIISWSNPGDVVLDPFLGSGTTAKMCVETGRRYIGIDISPEYCELSRRRVARARVPLFVEAPGDGAKPKQAKLF